jgi:hypothetical protein
VGKGYLPGPGLRLERRRVSAACRDRQPDKQMNNPSHRDIYSSVNDKETLIAASYAIITCTENRITAVTIGATF